MLLQTRITSARDVSFSFISEFTFDYYPYYYFTLTYLVVQVELRVELHADIESRKVRLLLFALSCQLRFSALLLKLYQQLLSSFTDLTV